jgi:hypothetical protein
MKQVVFLLYHECNVPWDYFTVVVVVVVVVVVFAASNMLFLAAESP